MGYGDVCPDGCRATISRLPVEVARSCVNEAIPHRRGGYVETNAVRAMKGLLSADPRRGAQEREAAERSAGTGEWDHHALPWAQAATQEIRRRNGPPERAGRCQ